MSQDLLVISLLIIGGFTIVLWFINSKLGSSDEDKTEKNRNTGHSENEREKITSLPFSDGFYYEHQQSDTQNEETDYLNNNHPYGLIPNR